ncbi:glycoside hydrolase family 9 protein [Phyllobacterium sp. 0TCS1.6C]|uniref:glycoside hydrolase family 9 protein n=1 Tax=unclassified Phyllobacterium TaxID=2638441 RepID=UPI002264F0C2|nr:MULTISPECIES: glycoside hydrolase family 9 protein [unclassified Phyllobacterium]MCX8281922.1 glycoside hydrolase family 9 protein [Phyllobacterium sp. 0TCS1.6C]MCX8295457.1 glycoside hydrolase family 9 protein [Phyllobacterium sp. 0TCS1.6A]
MSLSRLAICLVILACCLLPVTAIGQHASPVRVNQAGYLPQGPKGATIISDAQEPLDFRLLDAAGSTVYRGRTVPAGPHPSSGLKTHGADFSAFHGAGDGYRLAVAGNESVPFPIGNSLYERLSIDAQSWFYLARSGTGIRADIVGEAYARPAGHVGIAPNRGDRQVPCLDRDEAAKLYPDLDWHCDYRLDVEGGWYDAGDQGKYVVNGGIAVAQLMDIVERAELYANDPAAITADGRLRIPEHGNNIPDLLDEARWELEFLLKMVVPDGEPLAGMVHHKVHDTQWTGPPMLPHLDPKARALYAPSTAATLNLAAAAAQGARLFQRHDPAFAAILRKAAEKAWAAARRHPAIYAPSVYFEGGGNYGDGDVSDEFYWAAAELYLATGGASYLAALRQSPHWAGDVFDRGGHGAFDWAGTAGLARLHLALYGKRRLPAGDHADIRQSVIAAADRLLALQETEPFGQPYRPDNGQYDWGSNHLILQNMIVVSAAYDLTRKPIYLQGVRRGMDYLLGRNPMNLSYVTGYGTFYAKNQHSRWFAHQVEPSLPHPPPGSLAGGPNSSLVDEIARERLNGCVAQLCYVDDINAFGSNEITINWNAPLAYIASFLADTGDADTGDADTGDADTGDKGTAGAGNGNAGDSGAD